MEEWKNGKLEDGKIGRLEYWNPDSYWENTKNYLRKKTLRHREH
jgi:hypothetical protein